MKSSIILEKSMNLAWTQGAFARANDDRLVHPYSNEACSFCTIGKVRRIINSLDLQPGKREEALL